jgi:hypothetical protein
MNTVATLAPSLDAANPAAGIYFVPADGSALPWEQLRMQLQFLSHPPCYPKALLGHAQTHWPVYADDFRAAFAHFVAHPYDYADEQRMLHLYAGFLLAQFRDPHCFSLAHDLLSCTDRQLRESLGEDYEETLVPWIAAFCHQDAQRLQWLADAARNSAPYSMQNRHMALQALARCAISGLAPRSLFIETAMAYCRSLIAGAQAGELFDTGALGFGYDTHVSFAVADLLDVELTREILPELEEWFAQGHVDPMTLGPGEMLKAIEEAEQRAASVPPALAWPDPNARGLPQSVDQEFGTWGMFNPALSAPENDEYEPDMGYQEPYVRIEPKVGRNDPCPCGSGKKYKKCCGG